VSEKRIKRLLKEDVTAAHHVMAAQLLELAASPSRPETPPMDAEAKSELDSETESMALAGAGSGGAQLPQE
jgi:hypothetical protein